MPRPVRTPGVRRNEALANMQQGSHGRSGEVIAYSLFDTMVLASTTLAYDFFTVPLGQAGKHNADTNNQLAGVMPAGQRFTVEVLKLFLLAPDEVATTTVMQEINAMLWNTTAEIYLPGKDNLGYWTLAELFGISTLLPFAVTINGPQPRYTSTYRLSIPVILAAQTSFKVKIVHHEAPHEDLDDYQLKFIMSGTLERLS